MRIMGIMRRPAPRTDSSRPTPFRRLGAKACSKCVALREHVQNLLKTGDEPICTRLYVRPHSHPAVTNESCRRPLRTRVHVSGPIAEHDHGLVAVLARPC